MKQLCTITNTRLTNSLLFFLSLLLLVACASLPPIAAEPVAQALEVRQPADPYIEQQRAQRTAEYYAALEATNAQATTWQNQHHAEATQAALVVTQQEEQRQASATQAAIRSTQQRENALTATYGAQVVAVATATAAYQSTNDARDEIVFQSHMTSTALAHVAQANHATATAIHVATLDTIKTERIRQQALRDGQLWWLRDLLVPVTLLAVFTTIAAGLIWKLGLAFAERIRLQAHYVHKAAITVDSAHPATSTSPQPTTPPSESPLGQPLLLPDPGNHGTLGVDLLALPAPDTAAIPQRADFKHNQPGHFQLGTRGHGHEVAIPWPQLGHAMVAGKTGGGKSNTLRLLTFQALLDQMQLMICELESTTFAMLQNHKALLVPIATTPTAIHGSIERARDLISERHRLFVAAPGYPDDLAEYNQLSGQQLPRILLVLDEFTATMDILKAQDKRILVTVRELAMLGRKFGIHVIFAAHDFSKSALGVIRDQLSLAVCHRVESPELPRNVNCPGANAIPFELPGRAITNRWGEVQIYYLDKQLLINQAAQSGSPFPGNGNGHAHLPAPIITPELLQQAIQFLLGQTQPLALSATISPATPNWLAAGPTTTEPQFDEGRIAADVAQLKSFGVALSPTQLTQILSKVWTARPDQTLDDDALYEATLLALRSLANEDGRLTISLISAWADKTMPLARKLHGALVAWDWLTNQSTPNNAYHIAATFKELLQFAPEAVCVAKTA